MAYLGSFNLGDIVNFHAQGHHPNSGGAIAYFDSFPTARVLQSMALMFGTGVTTMAGISSGTLVGMYGGSLSLLATSGFALGKKYSIRKQGVMGGVTFVELDTFEIGAKVDMVAIGGSTTKGDNFSSWMGQWRAGTLPSQAGAATGEIVLESGAVTFNSQWQGGLFILLSGSGAGYFDTINSSVASSLKLTMGDGSTLPVTPASGNAYLIIPFSGLVGMTTTELQNAFFDELTADHTIVGTYGEEWARIKTALTTTRIGKLDNLDVVLSTRTALADVASALATAWNTTTLTESYASLGNPMTPGQALHLIVAYLTSKTRSGTTVTLRALNQTTNIAILTWNDAANPTTVTRTT